MPVPANAKKPQDRAAKAEATGENDEFTFECEGVTLTLRRSAVTLRVMRLIEDEKVMAALVAMVGEDQFELIADLPVAAAERLFTEILAEVGSPNS